MDPKEKFEEMISKVQSDPEIMDKFKENPVSVAEEVLGIEIPEEAMQNMMENLKERMEGVDFSEMLNHLKGDGEESPNLEDLFNKVKGMF